jgi:hypothetical protein
MTGEDWRAAKRAYLILAALVLSSNTVNVFSVLHDRAAAGHPVTAIEPVIWEYSSGLSTLLLSPLIYAALRVAPPARRWPRFALVHAAATLIFSALHVSGMVAIRIAVYAAAGFRYRFDLGQFPYEYRKDLLTYAVAASLFWLFIWIERQRRAAALSGGQPTFDIRDGPRTIRARLADIAAVSSAGNYVEFVLADGRRPLMRSTLGAVEAALAPHGFVRTHKSWLINTGRVSELIAQGSGDFTVQLDVGVAAPLSRRFPEALQRLRPAGVAVSVSGA